MVQQTVVNAKSHSVEPKPSVPEQTPAQAVAVQTPPPAIEYPEARYGYWGY